MGLEILIGLQAHAVDIFGDSQLVINQVKGIFKCQSVSMLPYYAVALHLLSQFQIANVTYVPRFLNYKANGVAQKASNFKRRDNTQMNISQTTYQKVIPPFNKRNEVLEVNHNDLQEQDWRHPIMQYLAGPSSKASRKIKLQSMQYIMYGNALYKRGADELLLECIGPNEALTAMAEVHEGICGAHQPGVKMRWLLRRHSYYCPTILEDCIKYARGYQACQK